MNKLKELLLDWKGAVLACIILLVIRLTVPLITANDVLNDVAKTSGGNGFPDIWKVTASWSKIWDDASLSTLHVVFSAVSFIGCVLPLVWAYFSQNVSSRSNAPAFTFLIVLFIAVGFPYIVPTTIKNSAEYTKSFCDREYHLIKVEKGKGVTGFDSYFPETDEQQPGYLDQFHKSCK